MDRAPGRADTRLRSGCLGKEVPPLLLRAAGTAEPGGAYIIIRSFYRPLVVSYEVVALLNGWFVRSVNLVLPQVTVTVQLNRRDGGDSDLTLSNILLRKKLRLKNDIIYINKIRFCPRQ